VKLLAVDPRTTLQIVKQEIADCGNDASRWGWIFSEIDEEKQRFTVRMKSPIDQNEFIIEIKFDQYKSQPLFIEFIEPSTGNRGTLKAYPRSLGKAGGFFHNNPCICHPCSRKAYRVEERPQAPHSDWNMSGWQQNPKVGSLTNLRAILQAIYIRISDPECYGGRMGG